MKSGLSVFSSIVLFLVWAILLIIVIYGLYPIRSPISLMAPILFGIGTLITGINLIYEIKRRSNE